MNAIEAKDVIETVFGEDLSSEPMDMRARAGVLAVLAVHFEHDFTVLALALRVCELVGEAPVEKAVVELDSAGVLSVRGGLVRPGEPVRLFREAIVSPPAEALRAWSLD